MEKVQKSARSYLFVPANRVERFEKALSTSADAIIIDLEDAVPVNLKNSARETLKYWLMEHPQKNMMIRINSKTANGLRTISSWQNSAMCKRLCYPKLNLLQILML